MEHLKNDNLSLLEAVVQNTEMGKNTLEQIVPMTDDVQFKAELLRERNIYRELNQEAHTAIEACGGTAQGQSAMAKLNTRMGIGMKTLTDKSTRNLAEMLSEGSSEILDLIRSGFVSYVINTRAVSSGTHSQDGASIRRCAIENGVTIFTSLDTARIVTEVLEEMTISVSTINAE